MVNGNTHVGFGVAVTALLSMVIPLTSIEFLLALCGAFIQDFDFLFSKYAPDGNHRLLITHSLWPGMGFIVISSLYTIPWGIVAGINLLIHVALDSLDWGVTLFGQKKLFGIKILYHNLERPLEEIKQTVPDVQDFFTTWWFRNPLMQLFEVISILVMSIALILKAEPFLLLSLIPYGIFAFFHYGTFLRCLRKGKKTG